MSVLSAALNWADGDKPQCLRFSRTLLRRATISASAASSAAMAFADVAGAAPMIPASLPGNFGAYRGDDATVLFAHLAVRKRYLRAPP